MKATEEIIWKRGDVRDLCIRNGWYKSGDNKDYSAMLDFIEKEPPTISNMMTVARDIAAHSNEMDPDDPSIVCYVMFEINRTSVKRFYYVEKEEGDEWE